MLRYRLVNLSNLHLDRLNRDSRWDLDSRDIPIHSVVDRRLPNSRLDSRHLRSHSAVNRHLRSSCYDNRRLHSNSIHLNSSWLGNRCPGIQYR